MISNRVELLCSRAQEAMALRDWEKAKQFYLLALEFRANAAEVHYGLATVYLQLRDMSNAAYHYHEVTRLDPTRVRAFINLGAALHQLGEFDEAETALCKGLQLDMTRGEGFYLLGLVHKSKGQIDKSLLDFAKALRCNPRLTDALIGMGEAYLLKNQAEMALRCYEQALRLRPNWNKALTGIQEAKELLARLPSNPSEVNASGEPKGLARTVDPESDGPFLSELHLATGMAEHKGQLLEKILLEEVSPVLVELSRIIINSSRSRSDLGASLSRFETALEWMRAARQGLEEELKKIEKISSRFPKE